MQTLLPLLLAVQVSNGPRAEISLEPRRLALDVQEEAAVGRGDAFVRRVTQRSARAGTFTRATLFRLQYDYQKATREYATLRSLRPRDAWARAATFGLATVAQMQGRMFAVDSLLLQASEEASADGDSLGHVEVRASRAVLAARTRGPRVAVAMMDSLTDASARGDSLVLAGLLCRRGNVYAQASDKRADQAFASGIAIARALGRERVEAECQMGLYTYLVLSGNPTAGNAPVRRAQQILRRLKDDWTLAALSQWSGFKFLQVGQPARANLLLRDAERMARRSGHAIVQGWTALNMATLLTGFGQFVDAERQVQVAERVARETGDASLEEALLRIGMDLHMARGDVDAAERSLLAYRAATERNGRPSGLHGAIVELAQIRARRGDPRGAHALLDSAATLRRRYTLRGFDNSALNARMMVHYLDGRLDDAAVLLDSVLARLSPEQLAGRFTLNVLRAGILAAQNDEPGARARLTDADKDYDAWHRSLNDEQMRVRAAQFSSFGLGDVRGMGLVFDLLARSGEGEAVLGFDERRRGRQLRERFARNAGLAAEGEGAAAARGRGTAVFSLSGLQQRLPDDGTAIIQFAAPVPQEPTTVLVITRAGLRTYKAAALDSLGPSVIRFSAMVRQGQPADAAALALGRALLGGALSALPPGIGRLMIIPDGVLHRLPFDALQVERGVPLLERYATASAPSGSVAAALWERVRRTDAPRLLAFGDPLVPSVGRDSSVPPHVEAMVRGGPLEPLPGSGQEVRAAGRAVPRSVVLTRRAASESALKQAALGEFRVIHFATHALVDEWSAARTSLILSADQGEDGFVTPTEVSALSFDADVVVLSACRTAAGEIVGGEGVQGFASSLLEAGARSVVATRWDVRDAAAARLSADLHRELRQGNLVVDALRTAKLAARRRGESSAVWSVLTVIGDSHATPFAKSAAPTGAGR